LHEIGGNGLPVTSRYAWSNVVAGKLEEIEATYISQRHRFDQCIIGEVEVPENQQPAYVLVVKGDADEGELVSGRRYRFYGRFSNYTNKRTGEKEWQFHFQTFVAAVAHDRESVVAYLAAAGAGNHLGQATAAKAFDKWGPECLAMIRKDPLILRKLFFMITENDCEAIASKLRQQQAIEDATIDLTSLLSGRGLPKTTARNAIKKWGNKAAQIIRRDPYSLMAFGGCGFKLCDSLYLELGLNPAKLRRQALCGWYAIASQSTGDVWFPALQIMRAIESTIGVNARPKDAIRLAMRLGRMSPDHYGALAGIKTDGPNGAIDSNGGTVWLAEGRAASNEAELARMIAIAINEAKPKPMLTFESEVVSWTEAVSAIQCRRCSRLLTAPEVHIWDGKPFGPTCITHISDGTDVEVVSLEDWIDRQPPQVKSAVMSIPRGKIDLPPFSLWPDPETIQGIDDHQRAKLAEALISRVAVLGGSPGTGKTYSVAMLIRALLQTGQVGAEDIAIGAPTGKAAVRLTEALEAAGVPLKARTWHSLLGIGSDENRGGWSFQHNEKNPWAYRIIIGDESSMVDTSLMRAVFAARPRGCHVLLVGDINQLPPVGAGAPLRDLIASKTCGYGELTEIKRNSGGIVEACAAIRDGRRWEVGDNLSIWESGERAPTDKLLFLLERCRARKFDPVWDCQVIVAVNDKSELSRAKLNRILQHELNPNSELKGTPFRLADKVVCGKNGKYPSADSSQEDVYVANGELGEVVAIEDKRMLIRLVISGEEIVIPRGKPQNESGDTEDTATGCNWDLAYAISAHKSQGSEWPVVIVMLDEYPGARRVCDRSWLYTAISRGKEWCFMVGKRHIADSMCRVQSINKRKTLLRERLQLVLAQGEMEGMF
jgi:hypothetical protein